MKTIRKLRNACVAIIAFGLTLSAQAGIITWDNGRGDGFLDSMTNWVGNVLPTTSDEVLLDNSVTNIPSTLETSANLIYGDLIVNSTNGSVKISQKTAAQYKITLSGNGGSTAAIAAGGATGDLVFLGNNYTNGTVEIGGGSGAAKLNQVIGTNGNFNVVNSGATLLIGNGGVLSGAFNLTKTGAGALTLEGNANTFGAGKTFELKAGTVNINGNKALGAATCTFQIDGGTTINNTSGGPITLNNNQPLTLNGDFTFTGSTNLNLGTGATTLGTTAGASRTITVSANTLTLGGAITNGATANSIIKAGTGTLTLSGTNTFSGATIVTNGILSLANASCLRSDTDIYIYSGATNNLAFLGTNTIHSLIINGVPKFAGVYNAGNLVGYLTGGGNLRSTYPLPKGTMVSFF